ncbi:MAG: putative glycoside hydrolase [bacterium]
MRRKRNKYQKLDFTLATILASAFLALVLFFPDFTGDATQKNDGKYPKVANMFWKTPVTLEEAKKLAKYDLVSLSMQAQNDSADAIRLMRQLNKNIIILAYTSSNEIPLYRLNEVEPSGIGLWHDLTSAAKTQWQLKTTDGKNISWWTGNVSMNPYSKDENNKTYGDFLADFYQNKILNTGLWDGLLLDNIWQTVSWVDAKIDIDNDGIYDNKEKIDRLWQQGNIDLLKKLRTRIDSKYLIVGNGDGLYHQYLNGRMFEGFPEQYEGDWLGSMKKYEQVDGNGYLPRINIIDSNTGNTNNQDYQKMRFTLASSLLFNGFYAMDYGPQLREHFWWYDEFDINLGEPQSRTKNLLNPNNPEMTSGLWQRDFTNGIVLVNSTDYPQEAYFDGEYEKIHGNQDPITNDGSIINKVTLASRDGIILLRRVNEIKDAVFINGAFARIFDSTGNNIRTGFFTYDKNQKGSNKVIKTDVNNNGTIETVSASNNTINVIGETGINIATFMPYGEKYQDGISLAVADINGDGKKEIITGSENGGGNTIKIFNWYGQESKSFSAFNNKTIKLGVNVAVGDINDDNKVEIIAGAGNGGGPHVKVFDTNGKLINDFFAYNNKLRNGVNLTAGDVNGDGRAEIITGAGFNALPEIKVFSNTGKQLSSFMAYVPKNRQGISVTVADLNGDGKKEIIALSSNVFTISSIINNNQ